MILYHGSFQEVSKPDLEHSRPNVDFGRGFYTTPIYDQAIKWSEKFKNRGRNGIISSLQMCFRSMEALSRLHFEGSEHI